MEFSPEKSRPLHNFTLPTLRWGYQRHFRCMKITHQPQQQQQPNSSSNLGSPPPPTTTTITTHNRSFSHKSPPASSKYDEGIEAIREKVMSDLREAADRMKFSMLVDKEKKKQQLMDVPAGANEPNLNSASARPCNLRTRRAACKEPPPPPAVAPVMESLKRPNGVNTLSNKPPEIPAVTAKSNRLRGLTAAANTARQSLERGDISQRPKFCIALTREDIESDFSLMTGKKPPRRPKKRARINQKQVDACFPGLWLSEVTPDSYKVPVLPDSGKA